MHAALAGDRDCCDLSWQSLSSQHLQENQGAAALLRLGNCVPWQMSKTRGDQELKCLLIAP